MPRDASTSSTTGAASSRTSGSDDNNSHVPIALATVALCSCSLIHAYLLINVFPYSAYMVLHLIPHLTPETAGVHAGILTSSFMAGRALSSYPFGRMADVYGRRLVLISSLTLSALFSILFGMSQSFVGACVWRFLLGLSNGIVGTVKTVVSELAATATRHSRNDGEGNSNESENSEKNKHSNRTLETRRMGMVVGMRAWGFLVSPAIGGLLSEPVKQYPSFFANANNTDNHHSDDAQRMAIPFLLQYPFVLPNFVGAILCVATALLVACCIQETLPPDARRSVKRIPWDCWAYLTSRLVQCCASLPWKSWQKEGENVSLLPSSLAGSSTSYTGERRDVENSSDSPIRSIWKKESTRNALASYWFFSLVITCLDEAFPLFCISTIGGLGVSEKRIGKILSFAGLVFALTQYLVYVKTVHHYGINKSLWIGCVAGFAPVVFIPVSLLLGRQQNAISNDENSNNDDAGDDASGLPWSASTCLVAIMAISKIFSCMFFTSISVVLNQTVEANQRATLNGVAALGGSIAKGIGPIVAGVLVSSSFYMLTRYGSIMIFTCIACMGVGTSWTLRWVEGEIQG